MKPMMFNADMVQAVREGSKTVTRRVVKFSEKNLYGAACVRGLWYETYDLKHPPVRLIEWYVKEYLHPPYHPGEIVYVPEAWRLLEMRPYIWYKDYARVEFRDGEVVLFQFHSRKRTEKWRKYLDKPKDKWQSPYHFPREAARLFLRIKDMRVERLQDITEAQANAEGARSTFGFVTDPENEYTPLPHTAREDFQRIWDSTVRPKDRDRFGWSANPWVWVIEFERVSKKEASGT